MRDCNGELLGRVRKGLASDQDTTAFEAHVESCESCRMTLAIMGDFDAVGETEPGDWERVARMGSRVGALLGSPSRKPARFTLGPWLVMAAAITFAGAAVAGGAFFWVPKSAGVASPSPSVPSEQIEALRQEPRKIGANEVPADGVAALNPEEEPAVPVTPEVGEGHAQRLQATAADMYRAANDARREGKATQAISTYQRLQQQYPGSPEARASRVSLGGLLLRNGSPSVALAQFDAYLATDGGQLSAEALFGRAQALRALGRSADEVQNLRRLVANYPDSAYATHAKRRLQELR